jgi:hypothetical protein
VSLIWKERTSAHIDQAVYQQKTVSQNLVYSVTYKVLHIPPSVVGHHLLKFGLVVGSPLECLKLRKHVI